MDYLRIAADIFLETVFPIRCLGCGAFQAEKDAPYLCLSCLGGIPPYGHAECVGCSRRAPAGRTCISCAPKNPLDRLLIAADYRNATIRRLIHAYKYSFVKDISCPLRAVIKRHVLRSTRGGTNILSDNPLFVPVPITRRRLFWRGFNQAELLAEGLATVFCQEYAPSILVRIKNGAAQAGLAGRDERMQNISGSFLCMLPEKVKGRTVLLIDDVCTTGATLNECAGALKRAGAASVMALVIARNSHESVAFKR